MQPRAPWMPHDPKCPSVVSHGLPPGSLPCTPPTSLCVCGICHVRGSQRPAAQHWLYHLGVWVSLLLHLLCTPGGKCPVLRMFLIFGRPTGLKQSYLFIQSLPLSDFVQPCIKNCFHILKCWKKYFMKFKLQFP